MLHLVHTVLEHRLHHESFFHGPEHWARVASFGLRLAAETPGCDAEMVLLFALFHDSQRLNDGDDPDHGSRGAALARRLLVGPLHPGSQRLETLCLACEQHTHGHRSGDPTIGACWDADRLDLWRVWVEPRVDYLSTPAAARLLPSSQQLSGQTVAWPEVLSGYDRLLRPAITPG